MIEKINIYPRIEEIITLFPNGAELYRKSEVFNKLVHCMSEGMTVYEAIEKLIELDFQRTQDFKELLKNASTPTIIVKEKN